MDPARSSTPAPPSSERSFAAASTDTPARDPGPGALDGLWLAPAAPRVRAQWLFDAPVRAALRARGALELRAARATSDGLLYAMLSAPVLFALGATHRGRHRAGLFVRLVRMDAEALALALGATWVIKAVVARERPYASALAAAGRGRVCRSASLAGLYAACGGGRNASFLSGHTAASFASAGLLCTQGALLVRGSRWAAVAAGMAAAGAMTTAVLRVVSDEHWATDTVAGAALGLGAGVAWPALRGALGDGGDRVGARVGAWRRRRRRDHGRLGRVLACAAAGLALGLVLPLFAHALASRSVARADEAGSTQALDPGRRSGAVSF